MEKRIGFGKRLGAYLLDIVIIYLISMGIGALGGGAIFATIMGTADAAAGSGGEMEAAAGMLGGALAGVMAAIAGVIVVSILIYIIEGLTGITPGKAVLGIKVGDKSGSTASIGALLTRFLVKVSGTVLTILAGITGVVLLGTVGSIASLIIFIGCFFVLGSQKQAIHDMISKTAVFKKADIA